MAYGILKVDTITFTDGGVDKSVPVSGLVQNPTFTGNITATGTISGDIIQGGTTVSGVTVIATTGTFTSLTGTTTNGTTASFTTGNFTSLTGTTTTGTTATFASGVFTTQVSGVTVIATTGTFTSLTGTTATFTSGIIASGTALLPSLAILSDPNTGIYSPGADQLAVATNGTGRLVVSSTGQILAGAFTSLNSASFQISTDSGASTSPYLAVFNTASSPTSAASTRLDLGFLSGAANYNATNTVLGVINWMGQASDAGYGGAFIQGVVTSGGNITRDSGHGVNLIFGTKPTNTAGAEERARIRADGTFEIKGAGTAGSSPAFSVNGSAPANSAIIDTSGRLLVGTSTSTGSTSNTAPVVAGLFKSFNGTISSAADNTDYTAFTAPNVNATYIVTARVPDTGSAVFYEEVAIVTANSGSPVSLDIAILKNGGLMTISLSGANVQVKQGSGATQIINWSAVCIG